jgi:hypothetical protein
MESATPTFLICLMAFEIGKATLGKLSRFVLSFD